MTEGKKSDLGDPPVVEYDPLVSEFPNSAAEASYEKWLIARVQKSLADPRPSIPHADVMAEAEAIIARAEARHKKRA
ncbi:antitoxin [Devosia sp.]|uniref:type II toxin-antitoxin system RelB family antitoxin n=1 Tax=Devosia sp. TaxID=1871048 RepID=UPI003BAAC89E